MNSNFRKPGQPFGWEPNTIIFDKNLSMKAKGLWLYMNSKPEGWFFSSDRIADECIDGKKAIQAGLRELQQAGYLSAKRTGDGRIIYTLKCDSFPQSFPQETHPQPQNGVLDSDPQPQNGSEPFGLRAEMGLINNTENNKNRIKERGPAGSAGNSPASRPRRSDYATDEEFEDSFYNWNTATTTV